MDFCVLVLLLFLNRHTERDLESLLRDLGVHNGPESFFKGSREQRGVRTTADKGIIKKISFWCYIKVLRAVRPGDEAGSRDCLEIAVE